ncbi:MAG: D-alanine--D-alanine ligase [Bacteroidales bacterium]|jgi:D-alanine-D-alanine ligase|nr:D-alanine--D-alanine ligase [Bacteroidales bacterium]
MIKKKKIAVVTGGNSGEYEISLKSADNIAHQLDKQLYEVYVILLKGSNWTYKDSQNVVYQIDKNDFSLHIQGDKIHFDAVFIAIHGNPGEDGKLQGYFEMLSIPYTGCDVLVSALTFNKNYCNRIVASYGIPIAPSVHLFKTSQYSENQILNITSLPCFVKPANSGSSVGMSKVKTESELQVAIKKAFQFDNQVLIEKFIQGREITCGIVKIKNQIKVLGITEIVSKNEFFDFEAKYNPALAEEITPAQIPDKVATLCADYSTKIYENLGCKGIVRIDYIFNEQNLYFIEINTIPGQTNESIIPKQLAFNNISFSDLCTELIENIF